MAKAKTGERAAKVPVAILGARVRELREARKWSQPELGWRANIHPANVSQVELNRRDLRSTGLMRLAVVLNTSSDYLLGLTDDSKPRTK